MTQDKFPHCILHTAASGSKPKLPTTLQALLSSDFAGLPNPTKTQLATIPPWKFSTKTVLGEYAIHISASSLLSGLRSGIFKPGKLPTATKLLMTKLLMTKLLIHSRLSTLASTTMLRTIDLHAKDLKRYKLDVRPGYACMRARTGIRKW